MRVLTIITAAFLVCTQVSAQSVICNGNLGQNIFEEGDFGRGSAYVLATDPGIAPGFQYSTNLPIADGEYVLTNDMAKWPNIYPSWLRIRDNSSDQLGYMMVVNASYAPGIFYEQTIDGLCDNTLYAFSADVINVIMSPVLNHILPNISFLIDDEVRFTTGNIPQDETWRTYGFTFITQAGQESVKLTLRNNAPGGLGNDLALDNISFRACGPMSTIDIDQQGRVCENSLLYPVLTAIIESDTGFVQWQISEDQGDSWQDIPGATDRTYRSTQLAAKKYLFRYLYGSTEQHLQNPKCHIISASRELEVIPINFTIIDTLCEGLSFDLGGVLYDKTGTYLEHLTAHNGCDSVVTLELTIVPDVEIQAAIETIAPLCTGYDDGQIIIDNITGGIIPYQVTLDGLPEAGEGQVFPASAGDYTVLITDRYGCSDPFDVNVPDPPDFTIHTTASEPEILIGHSTELQAQGSLPIQDVIWSPQLALSCPNCLTTLAYPFVSQHYIAMATSESGCLASDTVIITVDRDPPSFMPNVFSPNGDRINDTWGLHIDPLSAPRVEDLAILDRWGNVVHGVTNRSTIDGNDLWDGRYNSKDVPMGVYTYVLKIRLADDSLLYKSGSLTLIR